MIILVYVMLFLLTLIFGGVSIVLFLIFMLDSLIRGHDLPTSRRATQALVKVVKQYKPAAQNFYDVGCARGALSLAFKKALPNLDIHALDHSPVRIFFAKLKSKILRRKIDFRRQNLFQVDLSQADIVYAYLWHDLMPPLEDKLRRELKPGAMVITNTSHFPTWQPFRKVITRPRTSQPPDFETLFVYVK